MGAPSAKEVRVAANALEKEAGKWEDLAPDLIDCQLTLSGIAMSGLELGVFQIVGGSYEALRSSMEDRAREGSAELYAIGSTLRDVATVYVQEDEDQVHRFKNLW